MDCTGVTDLGPLRNLSALSTLDLARCYRITDLGPLRSLLGLCTLNLAECVGITDLKPLENLTALSDLDVSGCRIKDLNALRRLHALSTLKLKLCPITELEPLQNLPALSTLFLYGCAEVRDLTPLGKLSALSALYLDRCHGITDLRPLQSLPALVYLNLSECIGVTDLTPLRNIPTLTRLDLTDCTPVKHFQPIQSLLDRLHTLILYGCHFEDLPVHLCGNDREENVAELVRSHYDAMQIHGIEQDTECKLLIIGNGSAGKTSLVRYVLGEAPQIGEQSTHGIRFRAWETDILLDQNASPVLIRVNVWDFGGQDLHHKTHRLFFQSGAVYLLLWDPWETERRTTSDVEWYSDTKHRLQYWVDQIVSVDSDARILIVRSKADLDGDRNDPDWHAELPRYRKAIADGRIDFVRLSTFKRDPRWKEGPKKLRSWIKQEIASTLGGPEKRAVGKGRLAVKRVLRRMQEENDVVARANDVVGTVKRPLPFPVMTRSDFDNLVREQCAGSHDASNTTPVLEWLHRTGVVFWNEKLFGERILTDQRWAINGIYTLLDRELTCAKLDMACGHFTLENLGEWAWDGAGYTNEEQRLFLNFMQSCGLCFPLLLNEETRAGKALYVAPEYLPPGDYPPVWEARYQLQSAFDDLSPVKLRAAHAFLGDGVALALINQIGRKWSRSAVIWKWGVAFASWKDGENATAEITWSSSPGAEAEFGGELRVSIWGPDASGFLRYVLDSIRELPSFPPDATFEPWKTEERPG
jgi:internalin A